MRLVQLGILLSPLKTARESSKTQRLLATLGGKTSAPDFVMERGISYRDKKNKAVVIWRPNICNITIENVSNPRDSIRTLVSYLKKINNETPIGQVSPSRFISHWIHPKSNYSFVDLERKYREIMVAENDISRAAFDSSVLYDIKTNSHVLHHQSGAMLPSQLQAKLRFDLDNTPKTFIFLEASIILFSVLQYSSDLILDFMENALNQCISHQESFEHILEERL